MGSDRERVEDLAQMLRRVMDEKALTQTEIARRVGVHVSTVNLWVQRKRGLGRGPSRDTLTKLADALGESPRSVFAAAGRKVPGPLSPDAEARVLEIFRDLTAEQQRMFETQMRAVREDNEASA